MTTEDRLRAAFSARAEQLTEPKLDELAARHEAGVEELSDLDRGEHTVTLAPIDFERHHKSGQRRWIAPALAAAAVAAVAVGVAVMTGSSHNANGPATQPIGSASSQAPSTSPSPSTNPTPSGGGSATTPPYLPAGQTGSRADVPWSAVGAGWRLLQPETNGPASPQLYLYDPAGGRYLISDQLPPGAGVVGWSPDGSYAAVTAGGSGGGVGVLELRTGSVHTIVDKGVFVTFTRPKGQALLVTDGNSLTRYGVDGSKQLVYSNKINGIGVMSAPSVYEPDGSALAIYAFPHTALIGNDGAPLAVFDVPAGYSSCEPVRLWNDTTLLERCETTQPRYALFLQTLTSEKSPPTKLLAQSNQDYISAWPLSNQDVLVQQDVDCSNNPYVILHPDGTLSPLRLPAGVQAPVLIVEVSGDQALFMTNQHGCNGAAADISFIDYNMVTGATSTLFDGDAIVVDSPNN